MAKTPLEVILDKTKGEVVKEFEKVCVTDRAFIRVKKEMHNIFDRLYKELQEHIQNNR